MATTRRNPRGILNPDVPTAGGILGQAAEDLWQNTVDMSRAGLLGYQQALSGYTPEGEAVGGVLPLRYDERTGEVGGFATPRMLEVWNTMGGPQGALGAGPSMGRQASRNITGSHNPLDEMPVTYKGKEPKDWSPQDFEQIGNELGIERLGPETPGVKYKYEDGGEFSVPGGTEGLFTYYDLLKLKSGGIDASRIPKELHTKIQDKMARSVSSPEGATQPQMWSSLVFGMTSPNNPLSPNQMAMSRLRINTPEDVDRIANMIPWKVGDKIPKAQREQVSAQIANELGLGAQGKTGGIGARGTTDYTRVAEMAQLFRENPEWFRKRPDEEWSHFVERVASQTEGLSSKTGTFGLVWQDPVHAGISAIDRHMANIFKDRIFKDPGARKEWEDRAVALWNKNNPERLAQTIDDLPHGEVGYSLLQELNKTKPRQKLRMAKGGINPNLPEYLRSEKWIREPEKVEQIGENYKRALQANEEEALKSGLHLFSSQWQLWDRMRRRLEPHENMFPGLEKLPRMSTQQMHDARAAHTATGHRDYIKEMFEGEKRLRPTRPIENPSSLSYFTSPPPMGGLLGGEEETTPGFDPRRGIFTY